MSERPAKAALDEYLTQMRSTTEVVWEATDE